MTLILSILQTLSLILLGGVAVCFGIACLTVFAFLIAPSKPWPGWTWDDQIDMWLADRDAGLGDEREEAA